MSEGRFSRNVSVAGFVVAGIGFFLTRFTVTLVFDDPVKFLFAGLLPLVLGLLLAAFGVALAVGAFTPRFVRTVTGWTIVGTLSMSVLVVSTLVGAQGMAMTQVEPGPIFSNLLIGGGVGGAMVGVYAGQNRRNRDELRQQANRLATLNRILRDQVLNAVTVIKGHVDVLEAQQAERSVTVIDEQAASIERSIDQVGHLTQTTANGDQQVEQAPLVAKIETAITQIEDEHPGARFTFESTEEIEVRADQRLHQVFTHLLDNAARYSGADPSVEIEVKERPQTAVVCIRDEGPGLPEAEQATLETGDITEFDDPRSGFGLNVVRLLVESYGGEVRTEVTDEGTTIEVELARADRGASLSVDGLRAIRSYGVVPSHLFTAIVVALIAGGVMGLTMQAIAGIVPVIGALYGVQDPLVGWLTHQFHSIVFGMIYASLVAAAPPRFEDLRGRLLLALGFAASLWLFAAGIVMPFWLRLLGLPASLPNLTGAALFGHLAWGIVVGVGYHYGLGWVTGEMS